MVSLNGQNFEVFRIIDSLCAHSIISIMGLVIVLINKFYPVRQQNVESGQNSSVHGAL